MNKKLLVFGVLGFFAISFVMAIGYYALFSASFNVLPSINISGETEQVLGDVYDGEIIEGSPITLTNDAPSERTLQFSEESECDVTTSYWSTLSLTKKDTTTWVATGEPFELEYTVIAEEFDTTHELPEGYTGVYYKDNEANADDAERLVTAGEVGVAGLNLPHDNDWNWGSLANYCDLANGFDDYNQCRGAKIWLIPNADIPEDEILWTDMANYYYETDLIQYNAEGEIVLYSGASLTLTPVYEIGAGESGECVVTTTVA